MVSVAMVGMFGTPSNDPRSAGFLGFASCSLKAFTRALELIEDMIDKVFMIFLWQDVINNSQMYADHVGLRDVSQTRG